MAGFEWEEHADKAVEELEESVDTENQCIKEEHKLKDMLYGWTYIISHLDERIPDDASHLHRLNYKVSEVLTKIRDLVDKGLLKELKFEKEEDRLLDELEQDVLHRDWKAVKSVLKHVTREEESRVRLQVNELSELHLKFKQLIKIMKTSNLMLAINKDLSGPLEKEEFTRLEEYYFTRIYQFIGSYERIFTQLVKKEKILLKKLEKIS